jgi:hypothetical protein
MWTYASKHGIGLYCIPKVSALIANSFCHTHKHLGWQKKLSYCIAFSVDGATDVTPRYVRQREHHSDRKRVPEGVLAHILESITKQRRSQSTTKDPAKMRAEDQREVRELQHEVVFGLTTKLCSELSRHLVKHGSRNAHHIPTQSSSLAPTPSPAVSNPEGSEIHEAIQGQSSGRKSIRYWDLNLL